MTEMETVVYSEGGVYTRSRCERQKEEGKERYDPILRKCMQIYQQYMSVYDIFVIIGLHPFESLISIQLVYIPHIEDIPHSYLSFLADINRISIYRQYNLPTIQCPSVTKLFSKMPLPTNTVKSKSVYYSTTSKSQRSTNRPK